MAFLQPLEKELFCSIVETILSKNEFYHFLKDNIWFKRHLINNKEQSIWERDLLESVFKNLYRANRFACLSAGVLEKLTKEDLSFEDWTCEIFGNNLDLLDALDKIYYNIDDNNFKKYCDPKSYDFFLDILNFHRKQIIYNNRDELNKSPNIKW